MRRIQPDKKLVQEFTYSEQKLPTNKPVALYIRQSTDGQVKNNRSSAILQDKQMKQRLTAMSFVDIIPIATDQAKSGQMVKISEDGTKKLLQREGLDYVKRLAKSGLIGAIATFSPSRLYRDLTRTFYTEFVAMLEEYNIPLITYAQQGVRIYWPDRREDMEALIGKFAEAARFLDEEVYGKLIPAKMQAIESGSYGGGRVPMGYIVTTVKTEEETKKFFTVYPPHAVLIRWLFARYKALNGSLTRLLRECIDTGFMFPAFQGIEKIPHIGFHFDSQKNGYPLQTRGALLSILTNPVYIGWYCFNGSVVSKEAHTAIVSMNDFSYAYDRLSGFTLTGEVNENKPRIERTYHTPYNALLEGLLQNNGSVCYVQTCREAYEVRTASDKQVNGLDISIKLLDSSFTQALLTVLIGLEKRYRDGLADSLQERLLALQSAKTEEAQSIDSSLANVTVDIRKATMDKNISLEQGYEQGVRDAIIQLKRLYAAKALLEEKADSVDQEVEALSEVQDLHMQAVTRWEKLPFDKQKLFINLLVERANIKELSPHILQVDITFKAPLNGGMKGFLYRHFGCRDAWSDEELALLKRLYKNADRLEVLKALPMRSWDSILNQTVKMGLQRLTRLNTSGIHESVAYADYQLMHVLGLQRDSTKWAVTGEISLAYHAALTDEERESYPVVTLPDALQAIEQVTARNIKLTGTWA